MSGGGHHRAWGQAPTGWSPRVLLARWPAWAVDVYEAAERARRRLPHRRADAARLPSRRVLGSAPVAARLSRLPQHRSSARGGPAADPAVAFAHPLGGSRAVSVGAESLPRWPMRWERTGAPHRGCFGPIVRNLDRILPAFLGSIRDMPPPSDGGPDSRSADSLFGPAPAPGASGPRRGGRSWPARPPTPCCL